MNKKLTLILTSSRENNGYLDEGFWWVMRVGIGRCHEELEVRTDSNSLLAEGEFQAVVGLDELLEQDGLKRWIEFSSNIFDEDPLSGTQSHFKCLREVGVAHLQHVDTSFVHIRVTQILDIFICLSLRIDHQRPSARLLDDNTILYRRIIFRKAS